jgi:hypothetical protein
MSAPKSKRLAKKSVAIDPLWAELSELEGIAPADVGQHAQKVAEQEEAPKVPRSGIRPVQRHGKDYIHPDKAPSADDMLDDLSAADVESTDRSFDFVGSRHVARRLETDIYNAWVLVQCHLHQLRPPGALSPKDYSDRFWFKNEQD